MSQISIDSHRISYKAFGDAREYIKDMYEIYKKAYNLETIENEFELSDFYAFEYCKAREFFILVVPYTSRKDILLERVFSNNSIQWTLIGGSFKLNETFVEAASRLITKHVAGIELGEVEPLAIIKNTFTFKGEKCHHTGLAFITRVRNSSPDTIIDNSPNCRIQLIPCNASIPLSNVFYNDKVLKIAKQYIEDSKLITSAEHEIAQNKKFRGRYIFHNLIVKRLFTFLSFFVYPDSLPQLNGNIKKYLSRTNPKKIIDVACGENDKILDFINDNNVELIVVNDISWSQLEFLIKKVNKKRYKNSQSFLLFTNHDARRLPFKDNYFDSLVCKNVLHHMDNLQSVEALLKEITRISKNVLVIEILNPNEEGLWGRLRHKYYMKFLKDAGSNFLNRKQFDTITNKYNRTEQFEMKTVRGIYQFACFENNNHEKEGN